MSLAPYAKTQPAPSASVSSSHTEWSAFHASTHIEFLESFLKFKQTTGLSRNKTQNWSLGSWSKRLRISSAAPLTNILKGRKLPSPELQERMIQSMNLRPLEAEYLNTLFEVARQKGCSDEFVQLGLLRKLRALKALSQTETLEAKKFQFVCMPQHLIIRQMVGLANFREDEEWIQNHMRLEVTREEIRFAIQDLIHVGLLERKSDGSLVASSPFVETEQDVPNENGKKFLFESMRLAQRALYEVPLKERDFSSDVINFRSDRIEELKQYLSQFREVLNGSFVEQDEASDSVYQVNLQVFPVAGRKREGGA